MTTEGRPATSPWRRQRGETQDDREPTGNFRWFSKPLMLPQQASTTGSIPTKA